MNYKHIIIAGVYAIVVIAIASAYGLTKERILTDGNSEPAPSIQQPVKSESENATAILDPATPEEPDAVIDHNIHDEQAEVVEEPLPPRRKKIQVALILDTSGSMDGLIDQAKTQLWKIVNTLAYTEYDDRAPLIELALYQYGSSLFHADDGFMRKLSDFTSDLDLVSERLFALKSHGSHEYCGMVIEQAATRLAWSSHAEDLKMIFIAGNEPFTQGPVKFSHACRNAAELGITINSIYCGPETQGIDGQWQYAATLANGSFSSIDHNQRVAAFTTPVDKEIDSLGKALNSTYLAYGKSGKKSAARQRNEDANASGMSSASAAQRSAYKASKHYDNSHWDLVDATANRSVVLDSIATEELPVVMQSMNVAERKDFVVSNQRLRSQIQAQIKELNVKRQQHIDSLVQKQDKAALDDAILETIRAQVQAKGIATQP